MIKNDEKDNQKSQYNNSQKNQDDYCDIGRLIDDFLRNCRWKKKRQQN